MSLNQIDAKSVQFLNAVRYLGGKASITDIRRLTGLNRNETNYRFDKLFEQELIDITYEPSPGDVADRKVAHLTGGARRELEGGLDSSSTGLVISDEPAGTEVSRERFVELEQEVESLRQAMSAATWESRSNEYVTQQEFDRLDRYVREWTTSAENYLQYIRKTIEK